MTPEHIRLAESHAHRRHWKRWGPYLSERAWGTVREDYSAKGTPWEDLPHDQRFFPTIMRLHRNDVRKIAMGAIFQTRGVTILGQCAVARTVWLRVLRQSVKSKRVMNPQEVETTHAVSWHVECTSQVVNEGRL